MVALKLPKHLILSAMICSMSMTAYAESRQKPDITVQLNNAVNECTKIVPVNHEVHNNLVLLNAEISSIKSAGHCGCKSALLSYSVEVGSSKENITGEYGTFTSFHTGLRYGTM